MGRDKAIWPAWIAVFLPALEYRLSSSRAPLKFPLPQMCSSV
ncbi:hypothetical protein KC19_VG260600 [Ceratodon purpureus]|uniref:Uncharacterized protein n=1 Tax=Ceratodon purpureus TaxID=3225 RepID=A0A8T0HUJ2_CERPU|nr:hypothetical protein KC19_VG260600 [Ceratodon purpureus]